MLGEKEIGMITAASTVVKQGASRAGANTRAGELSLRVLQLPLSKHFCRFAICVSADIGNTWFGSSDIFLKMLMQRIQWAFKHWAQERRYIEGLVTMHKPCNSIRSSSPYRGFSVLSYTLTHSNSVW